MQQQRGLAADVDRLLLAPPPTGKLNHQGTLAVPSYQTQMPCACNDGVQWNPKLGLDLHAAAQSLRLRDVFLGAQSRQQQRTSEIISLSFTLFGIRHPSP